MMSTFHPRLPRRRLNGFLGVFDKAHLRTVDARIAELERAVETFKMEGGGGLFAKSGGGGDGKSDPANVERRLANLFKEKWARAAAERCGHDDLRRGCDTTAGEAVRLSTLLRVMCLFRNTLSIICDCASNSVVSIPHPESRGNRVLTLGLVSCLPPFAWAPLSLYQVCHGTIFRE